MGTSFPTEVRYVGLTILTYYYFGPSVVLTMKKCLLPLLLFVVGLCQSMPQYYDDPFQIAVDQIVRNTRLQVRISLAKQQLLDDCTNANICGVGAKCELRDSKKTAVLCVCKPGYIGRTRVNVEADCRRQRY